MSSHFKPVPVNHNDRCQRATQSGCDCPCDGMLHQRDVLVAAVESRKTASAFDTELTKLFGSAFTLLSTDPADRGAADGPEKTRREWIPVASASKQRRTSQAEQRAVDTTLRDVLRVVHGVPVDAKVGWLPLANELTAHSSWHAVATSIHAAAGENDEASGYFWASMLAATMPALHHAPTSPTPADILNYQTSTTLVFDQTRYPRGTTGNSVKPIKEMRNADARQIAADVIANALATSNLSKRDKMIVVALTGTVVSADLWKHPCGVRNLLLPAVKMLRRDCGATFSLDSPARNTERIITEELGDHWRARGVW